MMSKTHLFTGMACALAFSAVETPGACAIALAGGALGSVYADVDIIKHDKTADAFIGEVLALVIAAVVFGLDMIMEWGIHIYAIENRTFALGGLAAFIVLWIVGFFMKHRGFTHSILCALLVSASLWFFYHPLGIACAIGYASHLLLDFFNKQGEKLLFPIPWKMCLKMCYSNKLANQLIMWLGLAVTLALIAYYVLVFEQILEPMIRFPNVSAELENFANWLPELFDKPLS